MTCLRVYLVLTSRYSFSAKNGWITFTIADHLNFGHSTTRSISFGLRANIEEELDSDWEDLLAEGLANKAAFYSAYKQDFEADEEDEEDVDEDVIVEIVD